jgi:L-threonylcarbamoyladenylate synthase
VAFPTDTVYGLGCDAENSEAVRAIYEAKGREKDKPLVLFVCEAPEAFALGEESEAARRLAEAAAGAGGGADSKAGTLVGMPP